jgi:hypothetical protein
MPFPSRVELGEPEVEDLGLSTSRDEDVGRFNIAVKTFEGLWVLCELFREELERD